MARPGRAATWGLAALLVYAAVAGRAQAPGDAPQANPVPASAALALAQSIDRHYNALHSLELDFTQSYDGMGMHRVDAGRLLLTKSGKLHAGRMRWTYQQPAGKLFVLDGKNAYFYTPGQSEVQRVPAKTLMADGTDRADLRSPLALLLGHADLGKQLSGLTVTPDVDGDATLSGVPKGMENRVSRLSVTASAAGVIHKLVVEETDGARNSFTFTGEQPNVPAPESAFVFVPPPGTRVVNGMPPV